MPVQKHLVVVAAVAAALSLTNPAPAAPITGQFSISGSFVPMSDGLTLSDLLNANAIDFTNPWDPTTPTPGTPGSVSVTGADGDFAGILPVGTTGIIRDFAFGGTSFEPNFPAPPITSFEYFNGIGGNHVGVDLLSVQIVRQTSFFLELGGSTLINTGQYSATPGSFHFTGVNGNDGSFTFASVDPPGSVPEPASLALLGIGLAALGAARYAKKSR